MSDRPERLRREAWRWLGIAQEDLTGARKAAADPEMAPRLACFWAQQAAELALKAVLVAEDVDPPKTHDLIDLTHRCRDASVHELDESELETLSEFAVAARYPADAPDITADTPVMLIRMAARVVDTAAATIDRHVGPNPRSGD